ncbi:MAG: helix-turn-helix domain-containing protein [Chloroflexi bacterium]|nr:helix-turn-helix domain-containing protein [Chloroflexota bacterium]
MMTASTIGCGNQADPMWRGLEESPLVRRSLAEFRQVTGLAVKLVPAALPTRPIKFDAQENDFCRAVACTAAGCRACYQHQAELFSRLDRKLKPQQICCMGGMIHLAVPVVVAGRHVATVLGGGVRVHLAGEAQFAALVRHLRQWGMSRQLRRLRRAWWRTPQLSPSQLRAAMRLLDVLAQLFAQACVRLAATCSSGDPPGVAQAKQFVRLHIGEHLTTRQAAEVSHLSDSYFCRQFRRLTGMTFHMYVAQVRVEAAQAALLNTHQSVSEVAFAAGFQSISDFNRVFKARVGMAPSQFRQWRASRKTCA